MKSWNIKVGLCLWTPVRDFLKRCKFVGYKIDWMESSGWLSRTFTMEFRRIMTKSEDK